MKFLLQYLFGYMNIRIEGFFVEKVISRATNKKIALWNIKREKSCIVYANVGIDNYEELAKITNENKCKIEILKKSGLPCIIERYKKRKTILIMFILVSILLVTISNFVWNIQIEGNLSISKEELIKELNDNGLKVGMLKRKVDEEKIINQIRLDRQDISWIGITISGTNAIVNIVEAEMKPEIVNDDEYCSIVSEKDAQIIKISAKSGTPVVKEGDIVTKGDVLIAGWMEGKFTGTRYVHASGEIKAKVWYKDSIKIPLKQVIKEKTGNQEKKYKIKFNKFEINLYKTLSKFKKYDTIETNNKLKIFSNIYVPIEIIKITNNEIFEKEITYGNDEAKQIGIEKLSNKIESNIENKENILQKYEKAYVNNDYIEVELTYEVIENIGTKEKIVF